MYFDVETARKIVTNLEQAPSYVESTSSARCPLCGNWGERVYHCVKKLKNGKMGRYFVCPECGYRFKSISED